MIRLASTFFAVLLLLSATPVLGQRIKSDEKRFVDIALKRLLTHMAEEADSDRGKSDAMLTAEAAEVQRLEQILRDEARAEQQVTDAARMEAALGTLHTTAGFEQAEQWKRERLSAELLARSKKTEEGELRSALSNARRAREIAEQGNKEHALQRERHKSELEILRVGWEANPSEERRLELFKKITVVSTERDIKASVSIETVNASGDKTDGALISFQTEWDRKHEAQPATTKRPTSCKESIGLGWYFMWAERSGRVTSNRNRLVKIEDASVSVTIVEDR